MDHESNGHTHARREKVNSRSYVSRTNAGGEARVTERAASRARRDACGGAAAAAAAGGAPLSTAAGGGARCGCRPPPGGALDHRPPILAGQPHQQPCQYSRQCALPSLGLHQLHRRAADRHNAPAAEGVYHPCGSGRPLVLIGGEREGEGARGDCVGRRLMRVSAGGTAGAGATRAVSACSTWHQGIWCRPRRPRPVHCREGSGSRGGSRQALPTRCPRRGGRPTRRRQEPPHPPPP